MKYMNQILLFLLFSALVVVSRWLPHPPNFSPVLAIALFCGARFGAKAWTFLLPVLALLLSDVVLGFHDLMLLVYLSMLPMVYLGAKYPRQKILNGFFASVWFFVLTNLAVWWTSGMYPLNQAGLLQCFVLALPFFHNTLLSTWIFQGLLELSALAIPHLNKYLNKHTNYSRNH